MVTCAFASFPPRGCPPRNWAESLLAAAGPGLFFPAGAALGLAYPALYSVALFDHRVLGEVLPAMVAPGMDCMVEVALF